MKSKLYILFIAVLSSSMMACSDDEEVKRKGDSDVAHEGEKWNIASIEYQLVDQSMTGAIGQTFKIGTKENAGSFYFVKDGVKGSFEMNIEGYNKEDVFQYVIDNASVAVQVIEQSVGSSINQNVIMLNGEVTDTEMSLSGTITKQSTSGQFILTISALTLIKQ